MSFTPKGLMDAITDAATEETERQEAETGIKYPNIHVQLTGQDGNAYFILGRVQHAMKADDLPAEEIEAFMTEAKSGDYDNLLQTCMKWFDCD